MPVTIWNGKKVTLVYKDGDRPIFFAQGHQCCLWEDHSMIYCSHDIIIRVEVDYCGFHVLLVKLYRIYALIL